MLVTSIFFFSHNIFKSFLRPTFDVRIYQPFLKKKTLSFVLQMFLYLEAVESNTTYDWLNHMI